MSDRILERIIASLLWFVVQLILTEYYFRFLPVNPSFDNPLSIALGFFFAFIFVFLCSLPIFFLWEEHMNEGGGYK